VRPSALGCLEVENELESGRLLDGKVSGFGALEDLLDVTAPARSGWHGRHRHEAATLDIETSDRDV
jgi:hypothetical protein